MPRITRVVYAVLCVWMVFIYVVLAAPYCSTTSGQVTVKHWSFIQEVFLQKGCVEEGRHFFTQIQRYFMRVLYRKNLMYFGKFLDGKEERKKIAFFQQQGNTNDDI